MESFLGQVKLTKLSQKQPPKKRKRKKKDLSPKILKVQRPLLQLSQPPIQVKNLVNHVPLCRLSLKLRSQ